MLKACPPCLCTKAANAAKRQLGTVASELGGAEPEPAVLDPAMFDFQGYVTKNRTGTRHTHQHAPAPSKRQRARADQNTVISFFKMQTRSFCDLRARHSAQTGIVCEGPAAVGRGRYAVAHFPGASCVRHARCARGYRGSGAGAALSTRPYYYRAERKACRLSDTRIGGSAAVSQSR